MKAAVEDHAAGTRQTLHEIAKVRSSRRNPRNGFDVPEHGHVQEGGEVVHVAMIEDDARCAPGRLLPCWHACDDSGCESLGPVSIRTAVRGIELRSHGQGTLLETEEGPDLTDEELSGRPGRIEELRETFLRSRLAGAVPRFVERSFLLPIDGVVVAGRIDAIFGADDDGPWEIVDYKTGRREEPRTQLDVYALACIDVWRKRPEDLTLTYLYLSAGVERSYSIHDGGAVRRRVADWLRSIRAGDS